MDWGHALAAAGPCLGASAVLILITEASSPYTVFNIVVYEGQTGLILKFGKYNRAVDPGLTKVNP